MPGCGGDALRPHHQRRHGRQDRLDVAAGLQPENRAAVVEQVELNITPTADELLLAVCISPWGHHVAAHDVWVDADKGAAYALREVEVLLPVSGIEIVVEDAANTAHLCAVRQIEILVAPGLEAL